MDVEGWIIEQLEPVITAPEVPAELTMVGPGKLVVRAEVEWFEADSPDHPRRGVDVEVSIGGEPIASFGYTVSERGERNILAELTSSSP
jgi:hypothetical protein